MTEPESSLGHKHKNLRDGREPQRGWQRVAPMRVPLLDLPAQYASLKGEIRAAIDQVLESQHFILGPQVDAFEEELARYCGSSFAVSCASGSDALLLSLMAAGIAPGDPVLCPTFTFFATAGAITRLGARPVFSDVNVATSNMDEGEVERALRAHPEIKAIIPVHLFGRATQAAEIRRLARRHRAVVIEDAAQAIGAREASGAAVGSLGDFTCFSFFPSKNLGAYGDGGMITTLSERTAIRLRAMRKHGAKRKYYHEDIGINSRLDAIQAAVLRVKLRHLPSWNHQRRQNASFYDGFFSDAEALPASAPPAPGGLPLRYPSCFPDTLGHVFNQYVLRVPAELRDPLRERMSAGGVATDVYYPLPLHLQNSLRSLGYRPGDFPVSEALARESLAIPIYPELGPERRGHVASVLIESLQQLVATSPRRRRAGPKPRTPPPLQPTGA